MIQCIKLFNTHIHLFCPTFLIETRHQSLFTIISLHLIGFSLFVSPTLVKKKTVTIITIPDVFSHLFLGKHQHQIHQIHPLLFL
uniref:Uncharacterized protein n=1 Tax=Helianthus annuus TaxID=4232 RepID=A0A251VFX5_HELAN